MSARHVLIEQLGASSRRDSISGLAHPAELLTKVLPGLIARLKVARDDHAGLHLETTRPWVEQLGVATGKVGLPRPGALGAALFGLCARFEVTWHAGVDLRAAANGFIEHHALQWPLEERNKAWLLALCYETARRLPGR